MYINALDDKLSYLISCIINAIFILVLASVTLINSTAIASDDYPNWSVKGFGTLGFARSDSDTLGFSRETTQVQEVKKSLEITTDSRLGLQLDIDIDDFWHITTQFVVKDVVGDFLEQNLEWAFLKWNSENGYEIRAGRMGIDLYLLSDYKNVGYAYPWMRPPHEFYSNIPPSHFDGIDFKKTLFLENGELFFKVGGGYTATTTADTYTFEGSLLLANMVYRSGDWQFRAGYAHVWLTGELKSEGDITILRSYLNNPVNHFLIPNLNELTALSTVRGSTLHFVSLGTEYDDGTWLVHAEASYIDEDGLQLITTDTASAYFSLGRRFSDVTLYSRYGIIHSVHKTIKAPDINPLLVGTPAEPVVQEISLQLTDAFNQQMIEQQSLTLGLRWDLYPKVAFKAEWSHYWLGENGQYSGLWQKDHSESTPNHVNLFSFGFDFIF